MFLLLEAAGGSSDGGVLMRFGARDSYFFLRPEPHRMVTSLFLHSGWLHLASNLLALITLGLILEPVLGPPAFLLLWLYAGVMGNLVSTALSPEVRAVGASGGIFGLCGALLPMLLRGPGPQDPLRLPWARRVGMLLLLAVSITLGIQPPIPVDRVGHAAGLAAGLAVGIFLIPGGARYRLAWPGWPVAALLLAAAAWRVLNP